MTITSVAGLPSRIATKLVAAPAPPDRHVIGPCWLWTGYIMANGYGITTWQGRNRLAHRVVRHLLVGDIEVLCLDPKMDTLDHLCRVRHCVNPEHLEPVTLAENIRRGEAYPPAAAANRDKTHCLNGHPLSGANLYSSPSGGRRCRECGRASWRRWDDKARAEGRRPPRHDFTQCKRGHDLTDPTNLYTAGQGHPICRACHLDRMRRYRARRA